MNWSLFVQIALGSGVLGALGALIKWISKLNSMPAATSLSQSAMAQVDTALAQVAAIATRLASAEAKLDAAEAKLDESDRRNRGLQAALEEHRRWDIMVGDRLRALGVTDIPNPPSLWVQAPT